MCCGLIFSLIILFSSDAVFGQTFPTGGFQGGAHGNVKVKTWAGTVDNKWQEAGNWCPASLPGPEDDIVIPSTAIHMPEVDVAGMSCRDILIRAGAALTVNPGYTLEVKGKITLEKE